ncbi:MAG: hypothetical protein U0136_00730 [Bdellovibrionota bacterium]
MPNRNALAIAVGEVVGQRLVESNIVQNRGQTLEFHSSETCAVYEGVRALVQRFKIPGGIGLDDVDEVMEGQTVLDSQHADAVFALIAPNMPDALRRPLVANVMGSFDRRDGLLVVDATLLLFQRASVFEAWRPRVIQDRPTVVNRIARMGNGRWWANDESIPRTADFTLSRREIDQICERRDQLVLSN